MFPRPFTLKLLPVSRCICRTKAQRGAREGRGAQPIDLDFRNHNGAVIKGIYPMFPRPFTLKLLPVSRCICRTKAQRGAREGRGAKPIDLDFRNHNGLQVEALGQRCSVIPT
jgi:hypothetical protein